MQLQTLSMIRSNSYDVHKEGMNENALKHKAFTLQFIDELMIRARRFHYEDVNKQSEDAPTFPKINSNLSLGSSAVSSVASSITTFENNTKDNRSHQRKKH